MCTHISGMGVTSFTCSLILALTKKLSVHTGVPGERFVRAQGKTLEQDLFRHRGKPRNEASFMSHTQIKILLSW